MKVIITRYVLGSIAGVFLFSNVNAAVVYDNFGPGLSFDASAGQGFGSQSDDEYGLSFTPIDSGYLSHLTVAVSSYSREGEAIFTLYDDNFGEPGSILEIFNLSSLPDFGSTFAPQTITATGTTYLNSGQPYWLIASQPNSPDTGIWQNSTVAMDTLVACNYSSPISINKLASIEA